MKRSCAIFTMTHNETEAFPIWIKYYSKYFASEDIYVLDHDSTDGSIEKALKHYRFNVRQVHHDGVYNTTFILTTFMDFQRELLERYEIVVCCDADEVILADPLYYSRGQGLHKYLNDFRQKEIDVISCNSRSVQQQLDEPPIDLTKPILSQRSVWFSEWGYNKTVVSKIALTWDSGFHTVLPGNKPAPTVPIDNDLILLHLARMDIGITKQRNARLNKEKWDNEMPQIALQHQLNGEELEGWFRTPRGLPIAEAPTGQLDAIAHDVTQLEDIAKGESALSLEYIPERFKTLV